MKEGSSTRRRFIEDLSTARPFREAVPWHVESEEELRDLIAVFDTGSPKVLRLLTANHEVYFGVGRKVSQLSYVSCFSYLTGQSVSVRPRQAAAVSQGIRFAICLGPKIVRPEWLIGVDDALKIVVHIFEHDEPPNWVTWELSPHDDEDE